MNRALQEMLHCLNHNSGNLVGSNSADMSVLERQRAKMKWQQEQQQQQGYFCGGGFINNGFFSMQALQLNGQVQNFPGFMMGGDSFPKPDPGLENGWHEFPKFETPNNNNNNYNAGMGLGSCTSGLGLSCAISRTSSCPPAVAASAATEAKGKESVLIVPENSKLSSASGKQSFKKRKAEKVRTPKAVPDNDNKDKKVKVCAEEGESKITDQTTTKNNNSNKETSLNISKENNNSKASEVQKPDYIHVRARRGQATDSHSLAERVRREKISERMRYLQDLVPGCNKITGKAGMLDEIINYVQSLQRQVEFLSMKLAAVNPRIDFNIDDLFTKDVFPPCPPSFPMRMSSSDLTNPAYLQFSSGHQMVSCSGLEMGISPSDMGLRRTISAPVSVADTFIDTSCFTQIQPSTNWEADFQSLYNVNFDQGRSLTFQSQPFAGPVEGSNLKMEM